MKRVALIQVLLCFTLGWGQSSVELRTIYKEDGKFGVLGDHYQQPHARIVIPPKYDSLYWLDQWSSDSYMVGVLDGKMDIIRFYHDKLAYEMVDTLGINNVMILGDVDSYDSKKIVSNADGELFNILNDFEPFETDETVVIRKSDGLYYLVQKGEFIVDKGFKWINQHDGLFACITNDGTVFYDSEGKKLFDQAVDTYRIYKSNDSRWVSMSKGELRGHFTMDGKSSKLRKISTPDAVIDPDYYEGTEMRYPVPSFRAFVEGKKYGLIDAEDNIILPAKEKQLIVWKHEKGQYVFIEKRKNRWEVYNCEEELDLIKEHEFDKIIGFNNDMFVVENKGALHCILPDSPEDAYLYKEYEFKWPYQQVMNARGKIGVMAPNGSLKIPCIYDELSDEKMGIFEVQTDQGTLALGPEGDTVSPVPYELCYPFELTDSAFCYRDGIHWGIFTSNNNGNLSPSLLYHAEKQFHIDVIAHTHLADAYAFIEGDKIGFINKNGATIHPAEFDSIIHESIYEGPSMYVAVNGNKTYVFSSDGQSKKEVKAKHFIEFSEDWGYVFATEDSLLCIDPNNLQLLNYHAPKYPADDIIPFGCYYEDQCAQGVVNSEGQFIIPMQYPYIKIKQYGDAAHHCIIVRDSTGASAMYNIKGEAITDFKFNNISQPCSTIDELFFFKYIEGGGYLASWNAHEEEIKVISTKDVAEIKSIYKPGAGEPVATITYTNGKKASIYADLRIEPIIED